MFDQLTKEEIEKYTNESIDNIKQNKDIISSLRFLEEQYSGTYLSVLNNPKYTVKENDAWEYFNNKKVVIFDCANKYDKDKSPFVNYLYRFGCWRLAKITNNFYQDDIIYKAEIIGEPNDKNEGNINLNYFRPSDAPHVDEDTYLQKDSEKIIRDYFKKKNDKDFKADIIILRLLHDVSYIDIIDELKLKYKGINFKSKQRVEQIYKLHIRKIREILKKDLIRKNK